VCGTEITQKNQVVQQYTKKITLVSGRKITRKGSSILAKCRTCHREYKAKHRMKRYYEKRLEQLQAVERKLKKTLDKAHFLCYP
jgi:predicted RNase H-like nuclease (RuvC/YqgF family)